MSAMIFVAGLAGLVTAAPGSAQEDAPSHSIGTDVT